MMVKDNKNFNSEFPETYDWNKLDSLRLTAVAKEICQQIDLNLQTSDKHLVPGFRQALRIIAEYAIE